MNYANILSAINETEGFFYEPVTGKLYRIAEVATAREKDDRLTAKSITFKGKQRQSTHVIFFLMTGRFPNPGMLIDHIDRDPSNNCWNNLREATPAQNMYNKAPPGRWNAADEDLVVGVNKVGNRYRVQINMTSFGTYATSAEANAIAAEKRKELHGAFLYRPSIRRV